MKRELIKDLIAWKSDSRRKPLVLQGARQVGKTWLVKSFGETEYKNYVHFNFEKKPEYKTVFEGDLTPHILIEKLSLIIGKKINAENTLIFFDEIQVCPEALTSLKYFYEEAPEFHIIAAGSLLGVSVGKTSSFPVGKVNFLTLYPLSFKEFLVAIDNELLAEALETIKIQPEVIHNKALEHLKTYFLLGGMPEVLNDYIKNKDIRIVRKIQNDILEAYKNDFSKYADPAQAIKLAEIWDTIPFTLAKENKKFKYSDVKSKARASHYEQSIAWLKNAGLIYVVNQIRAAKVPLAGYADHSKFKIYLLDTGLLGALLKIPPDIILSPTDAFSEYNGAFVENYVCLELHKALEQPLHYWASEGEAEVDFVLQFKNEIIPLEAKSGTNRNIKSLRSYANKFNPRLLLRASPRTHAITNEFINIPLYNILSINTLFEVTPSSV
jgi:uncharacterized protein